MNSKNSLTGLKMLLLALCVLASISTAFAQQSTPHTSFKPGGAWLDTDGKHIDCHGGNIIYVRRFAENLLLIRRAPGPAAGRFLLLVEGSV